MRMNWLILRRRRTTLALLVALGAILGVVPFTLSHARQSDEIAQCTNQTIAGAYGFRTAGVQVRPDGTYRRELLFVDWWGPCQALLPAGHVEQLRYQPELICGEIGQATPPCEVETLP